MTLLELVQQAADRLEVAGVAFGQGTDNAFDEAAWLVLWRLGLPLDTDLSPDGPHGTPTGRMVSAAEAATVADLVDERIRSRRPAAYLTGEAWLQGVPFFIDERSIVPRSFIAELIADASLDPWLSDATRSVLDLCCGNGSLAVLAAMAWPDVTVTGADVSEPALQVAQRNLGRHQLSHRVSLVRSNGLQPLDGSTLGRFDLVLCNPPYVNRRSMEALPPEFRAEPALALDGGEDGMDFIRTLLAQLPDYLSPNGVLVLEIGHERAHFEAAFPRLQPVWMSTSAGDDQVLLLTSDTLMDGLRS